MKEELGICVVSHPIGETRDTAQRTLLDILSSIAQVSLVASDVPADTASREQYEVVDIGDDSIGGSVVRDGIGFLRMQLRMCRVLSRRDEEVILFFGTTLYILPILWARLRGKTVILEPRGDVPRRVHIRWEQQLPSLVARVLAGMLSFIEHLGYRTAHAIITYTPSMASELQLDRYEHKLYPNGARYVDTDRFDIRTPFQERDAVVGYVGRFEEGKGVKTLAEAVPQLPNDIIIRFTGDGPLAEELTADLADEIEQNQVEVSGWVDHEEVPLELNRLQLLVLLSESEGLPTIVLEALACGTPVYATPVSGVPDVVRDGKTGFLNPNIDATTLAQDIERILHEEPLGEISENGRTLIESEYSLEAAIGRYQTILDEIDHAPNREY